MEQNKQTPNQTQSPAETGLYDSVQRLLQSEEIKALPSEQQGPAIVDSFIGELVAQDGVVGSDGQRKSATEILGKIDKSTAAAYKDSASWNVSLSELSRTDGLRLAVHTLAGDERTSGLFGQLGNRLRDVDGKLAMTSYAQVSGYLNRLTHDKPTAPAWKNTLLGMVDDHITGPAERTEDWKVNTSDLLTADAEGIRKGQLELNAAMQEAQQSGVDIALLQRSSEVIRQRAQAREAIGDLATAQVIQPANSYEHLFQA
jgi:hypothetical protein